MRANLAQREPAMLDKWEKTKAYEAMIAASGSQGSYVLHDGPHTPTAISIWARP